MNLWLPSTIKEIQSCQELTELKSIIIGIQKQLDCDFVMYSIQIFNSLKKSSFLTLSNFPKEWLKIYKTNGYVHIDPIQQYCVNPSTPICWDKFYTNKNRDIHRIFQEAKTFGLEGGVTVGLRVNNGESGIFSIVKKEPIKEGSVLYYEITFAMAVLQPYIYDAFTRLSSEYPLKKGIVKLTKREIECLYCIADGQTSSQIATTLAISESTVSFHIKNSITKLGVKNRLQAISKAILLEIILIKNDREVACDILLDNL